LKRILRGVPYTKNYKTEYQSMKCRNNDYYSDEIKLRNEMQR